MAFIRGLIEGAIASAMMLFWIFWAFLLCCTSCALYPFVYPFGGRKACAKIIQNLADFYWGVLTRWVEHWGRVKVEIAGDKLPVRENVFIVANHRWLIDWLMIFCLAVRKGRLGCIKLFVKNSVFYVPGVGFGLYLLDFIFLKRDWERDAKSIQRTFQNLKQRKLPFWLVSHLEGTRLTPEKLTQSHEFAKKKDLPQYNNVLLPRIKGFVSTVEALKDGSITAIYNLTIVYNDGKKKPSLRDIAMRRPSRVNIYVKRYPISSLPLNSEAELTKWLYDRWSDKDHAIDYLLEHGHFPEVQNEPYCHPSMYGETIPYPK